MGVTLVMIALGDLGDQYFCAGRCGGVSFSLVAAPLFAYFGHWGPRVAILTIGIALIGAGLMRRKRC